MAIITNRRKLIAGLGSSMLLAGCDSWSRSDRVKNVLASAEGLTMRAQRLITDRNALAREFTLADLSPRFRANGSRTAETAQGADYQTMLANNFADYRLQVDGLVRRPLSLSLADLRAMPSRTQITRHDCVEGWSAIGQWTGTPLSRILDLAGLRDSANYIVFHCADTLGRANRPYYESIDLIDAFHPQTILAYDMNGEQLPERHGAPLRARIERQLGYKHAKFVMRLEAVESFDAIHGGKGGYWEDVGNYAWYAGI
ncbi:molybdopterin-dependent oxidoreductase [Parasphingopyxis algicola]|uniref:molybdopterin-binding protein n=1 Tax=Parasphingopyxis algicola TaxID=2026624 RepID=UPI0015A10010|nr:molybdopterin-binding protein [Parasphingopyxis algicola]QLC26616.1 molybdopterin-dependent oxidoreductase [Parasphingopyxis algicola]